ncbi:GntR family transcriptional regulator YhfZ [uncultured Solobacterium sp.]|jgi:hypothetical protein|uniref:GntR family transcriptional regulator YhfZ n=1 Tax=uncultured Solobacterium sp. TaxID=747375 RepID=UPI0025CD98C2|nr:GntR family transcriptional regulator YhfZ [uncultured Solobacterium sp.]
MDYNNQLMSKNGLAVLSLAKALIKYKVGDRTPTVTELSEKLNISRGTAQSALKTLQNNNAIHIVSKGHLGSYVIEKNDKILLELAGINLLVGAMPLPYSRKYEGLATGIITTMENKHGIPMTLSYMRGAKNRIAMVLENRYNFAVVSKYAAKEFLDAHKGQIDIVCEFGEGTYCSSHVIVFHDAHIKDIQDGMRIGIDRDSIDQSDITKRACGMKKVEFIPVESNNLLRLVQNGEIDAAVWNEDEIIDKMSKINYVKVTIDDNDDTNAVIVTNGKSPEMTELLRQMLDVKETLTIQNLVLDGIVTPSY